MITRERMCHFAKCFSECRNIFSALGDENRQHLILEMLQVGRYEGLRVGDIAKATHLSRTAISHHLRILKNAGIVKVREEGTKNYYYFDPDTKALDRLISTLEEAKAIAQELPDRGEL